MRALFLTVSRIGAPAVLAELLSVDDKEPAGLAANQHGRARDMPCVLLYSHGRMKLSSWDLNKCILQSSFYTVLI